MHVHVCSGYGTPRNYSGKCDVEGYEVFAVVFTCVIFVFFNRPLDDLIVTPLAQLIDSLRKVKSNYLMLLKIPQIRYAWSTHEFNNLLTSIQSTGRRKRHSLTVYGFQNTRESL